MPTTFVRSRQQLIKGSTGDKRPFSSEGLRNSPAEVIIVRFFIN
jgi:hypothetical protein